MYVLIGDSHLLVADSADPVGGVVGDVLAAVLADPLATPVAERATVDDEAQLRTAPRTCTCTASAFGCTFASRSLKL